MIQAFRRLNVPAAESHLGIAPAVVRRYDGPDVVGHHLAVGSNLHQRDLIRWLWNARIHG